MESLYIELIQWRSIERLVSILIGGLSIAAGWHLFLRGVIQEQSADIKTQTIKVSLQKVGPGVFFALFGAWIVINISTTQATLDGFKTPDLNTQPQTQAQPTYRLAFLSSGQDAWQLKFVAGIKTLEQQQTQLNQALASIANDNPDELRQIKMAIYQLSMARKKFLLEAFPPALRDACKNNTPVPAGFTQDTCELLKEYENAVTQQ